MDAETLRVGRDRLTRVFRFLQALNQHRNPAKRQIREQLWHLWFRDLPDHNSIRRGQPSSSTEIASTTSDGTTAPDRESAGSVLKVRRPRLTKAPQPSEAVAAWLAAGWDDPFKDANHTNSRNEEKEDGQTAIVNFDEDPQRVSAFQAWKNLRDEWARNEQPARSAMKIFENLYGLYGRVEREAERVELVIGDGILSWRRPDGGIYHPVLLQRLQLEFDPRLPEFRLTETESPIELYTALFQSMSDVDGRAIARCCEELEQGGYGALDGNGTGGYLRRLATQLSPRGEFVESGAPQGEKEDPQIGRDPVIFLRSRTLGFAAAIDGILEDLRARVDLPWPLLNIVGVEAPPPTEPTQETSPAVGWEEPEEVLLSKPANPEQIRIAQEIERCGGVLVQGPPGTGKTHTIGNLIGHLLAQGKTVLVTSHTTKALRMVRQHVVSELRPLCVSVLENDLEGRKQLESAVGSIAERLSRADARGLEEEAANFCDLRKKLAEKLRQVCGRLIEARADEYRDIVIGGKAWSPSEAARKVTREQGENSWIPRGVESGAALPLSEGELVALYRTNTTVAKEDEFELSAFLPSHSELLRPGQFNDLLCERSSLGKVDRTSGDKMWNPAASPGTPQELEALADRIRDAVEPLSGKDMWKLEVISVGKSGLPHREAWHQLLAMIERLQRLAASSQAAIAQHGPKLSDHLTCQEQIQIAEEIVSHLGSGRNLGPFSLMTRRKWRKFVQTARVASGAPRTAEQFHSLAKLARLKASRKELAGRWDRQMGPLGAPSSMQLGPEIERTLPQFSTAIWDYLQWNSAVWEPLEKELKEFGFSWEKFMADQPVVIAPHADLVRLYQAVCNSLLPMLGARANALRWAQVEEALSKIRARLSAPSKSAVVAAVVGKFRAAINELDANAYKQAFDRLVELEHTREELNLRHALLARLEPAAPAWAAAIRDRNGVHGNRELPGDPSAAWLWLQMSLELERRAKVSLEELQKEAEGLKERLRNVTVDLIDRRSWGFQTRRTALPQRQALIGWLDTIRKIGKGHGIRVPKLKVEAARKMSECRGAVPVWIMPLSRVVDNFDLRKTRFDVVIIDEASQSDVMALVACYLGNRVVIVGDHEQVSPSAVGQDIAVVQNLIETHLQGIPNAHLYDGKTSVYDLARQSFGQTICLVEHFRCVPEIIQFSNDLSYDGRIRPLRDASRVALKPHVFAHHVVATGRIGKINSEEAATIASLIVAATQMEEYRLNESGESASFGVVSLVGEDQALEIEEQLRARLAPQEYDRRRILCGTAAQFQGDERDVMFLSVVDTPEDGPLPLRDQEMFKQRFNVASSRARDQLWVVHSLSPQADLKKGDLRRRLIEHALDPTALMRALEERSKKVESEFERLVMRRLVSAGYGVTPQWKVGAFRIDLVVEGDNKRLAVECDGDRYHPIEKLAEDMERQAILERLGWVFVRIRGSEFFRDPDRAMRAVFERLDELEIPTMAQGSEFEQPHPLMTDSVERVIRRAEELRRTWKLDQASDTASQAGGAAFDSGFFPRS
jgi:very-short-patch-repair endonuclease